MVKRETFVDEGKDVRNWRALVLLDLDGTVEFLNSVLIALLIE